MAERSRDLTPAALWAAGLRGTRAALWGERQHGSTLLTLPLAPRPRIIVASIALVLTLAGGWLTFLEAHWSQGWPVWLALAYSVAMIVPLLALPGAPLTAWRCATLAMAVGAWLDPWQGWPWPVVGTVIYVFLVVWVSLTAPWWTTLGAWIVMVVAILVPPQLLHRELTSTQPAGMAFVLALLMIACAAVHATRRAESRLAEQTRGRARDATERAVLGERARIARELHDVVAHHISMIAIQAQAAPLRDPDLPQGAKDSFALIETTARESLTDMRRVIGALRHGDGDDTGDGPRAPTPSLSSIVELVDQARAAGQEVDFEVIGEREVPEAVGISAYRIVQESLSNARRHAPGAPVRVRVALGAAELGLEITNDPEVPA